MLLPQLFSLDLLASLVKRIICHEVEVYSKVKTGRFEIKNLSNLAVTGHTIKANCKII